MRTGRFVVNFIKNRLSQLFFAKNTRLFTRTNRKAREPSHAFCFEFVKACCHYCYSNLASELMDTLSALEITQFFSASFTSASKSPALIPGTEPAMDK